MKRQLYIIGARGCGREVYNLFDECKPTLGDIECVGFLDSKTDALDGFDGYPPIISCVEDYEPKGNDCFICALGEPKWVKHYTEIIESKGGKFISLISPRATIGRNTKLGYGCIVGSLAELSCDIYVGNHVYIGSFSNLGHDVCVEDYTHIGAFTFLGGNSKIGSLVTCHPRVNILPGKKVGDSATVGAGSIVIKNVASNATVFGVPAKKII